MPNYKSNKIIFKNLLQLCIFLLCCYSYAKKNTVDCVNYPVGQFNWQKGFLIDELGTVVANDLEKSPLLKAAPLKIKDLASGLSFNWTGSNPARPVSRTTAFDKILLKGIADNFNMLYLVNSKGEVLDNIVIPQGVAEKEINGQIQFNLSDDGKYIFITTIKSILEYNLDTKKWNRVDSLTDRDFLLNWLLIPNSNMIKSYFYKDKLIYRTRVTVGENNKPVYHFQAFKIGSYEKINEISSSTGTGIILNDRFLLFYESSQIHTWNLETGKENFIPFKSELSQTLDYFFIGPNDSLGIVMSKLGKVLIYSQEGQLLKQYQFSPINTVRAIVNSPFLFIKLENNSSIIFDIQNGVELPWPGLLDSIFKPINSFAVGSKIFLGYKIDSNSQIKLIPSANILELNITSQCLKSQELTQLFSKMQDATESETLKNKNIQSENSLRNIELLNHFKNDSILSTLVIENKIPGVDPNLALAQLQKQEYNLDSIAEYILLINDRIKFQVEDSNQWKWLLSSVSRSLKNLPESVKNNLIDSIAIQLAERVQTKTQFAAISASKIVNIFVAAIKPYFGIKSAGRTDFTFVQNGDLVEPIVLGTHPIDGESSPEGILGIYTKRFPQRTGINNASTGYEYSWVHQEKKWKASGDIRLIPLGNFINAAEAPPYEHLWKDKKLVGAIVLSSNLLDGFETLALNIIKYYEQDGFSFGLSTMKLPSDQPTLMDQFKHAYLYPLSQQTTLQAKEWLQQNIESGNIDYLVKEAHAGGTDQVVWLAGENIILKGTKKYTDGRSEEIYILYPKNFKANDLEVAVQDQEFGEWIRQREKNKGSELVYINGSCWSHTRSKQELIAARSQLLIELPTILPAWTFQNKSNNHERLLIDLIRKGNDYLTIKKELDKLSDPPNPFIFPNEDVYQDSIWEGLKSALDYSIQVQVQN